ncbi:centromere protein L-like [Dreissena polymorpha]|uniref:Centromere protein L n=1 Tax=Dreissena polymorpha TaxID=45954 RepID=A0A9D4EHW0_DREPO|nr:centromere protein L-like [Dreissena polymorpha]XP_052232134.1 centromere protein L-like [Dreissena polymorpha]KAH3778395.1 hypothetical protein DPMN_179852 [Dreissena polymorpha]
METPSVVRTPLSAVSGRLGILRSSRIGTPYRTPNIRRFGPLGTSWRTPVSRHAYSGSLHASTRTSTPLHPRASLSMVTSRTEIEENNIKQLIGKQWHMFRLTPLFNFKSKKSDLSMYSKTLSSHIAAETKKGLFVDITEPGDATVNLFSGLDTGVDDPKAVLIEVKGKARNKTEEKVVCQAVLFSTDLEFKPLRPEELDNFTYYSSMLIHGPVAVSDTVQNWLEVQFDCRVIKQTFTAQQLGFMAAMFTGLEEEHKPVELVYKVPTEVEGLSEINYSTNATDCLRLWKQIRLPYEDRFTDEEAEMFISGLESHFYEIFNIKLSAMPLHHVSMAVISAGHDGKFKLTTKSIDNVLKVLRHLTDLALDNLKIA